MSPVWDESKKTISANMAAVDQKRGAAATSRGPPPTTKANLKASYKPTAGKTGRLGSTS